MHLSTEHQQVADMTRRFANEVIRPQAERLDHEEAFAGDIYREMGEIGLFGIAVPEQYGGAGLDCLAYSLVMEELSRGYASVADQCGLVELLTTLRTQHGTEDQKQRWIAPLVLWWVLKLPEPRRWLRHGVILGVLVAIGFSIAAEGLFFTALATGVFLGTRSLLPHTRAAATALPRPAPAPMCRASRPRPCARATAGC